MPRSWFVAACAIGDLLLLGLAYLIFSQSPTPMGSWEIAAYVVCVGAGACLMVSPFLLDYRSVMKVAEADRLKSAVTQIQNLELIGRQVSNATANWQTAHEHSVRNVEAARQLGEAVTSAARAFSEFIHKANDSEKNHLRLEVEKLKRAEGDWLQVLIHVLDHVYAVYRAAAQSRQQGIIEQLSHFQNACRDVSRRVGVIPFVATPGEMFNPKLHQLADPRATPQEDSRVGVTLATGYTFQGRLLRPAVVEMVPIAGAVGGLRPDESDTSQLSVSKINKRRGEIQDEEEVIVQIGTRAPGDEAGEAPPHSNGGATPGEPGSSPQAAS